MARGLGPEKNQSFGSRLTFVEPDKGGLPGASVSIILRGEENPMTLLIKRAEKVGDPWSGQIAFPGGKARSGEATLKETAIRETGEEVGIDLAISAEFLGYFGPFKTHTGTMAVTPSVFKLKEEVEVTPNREVASHRWVEIKSLLAPRARSTLRIPFQGGERDFPALRVEDYVVWGLTYRIISSLFGTESHS